MTTRNRKKFADLAAEGFQPVAADWTDRRTLDDLPPFERILIAVSYDRHSDQSRYDAQVGGLGNLLEVIPAEAHVCYISTTGVYHQTDGGWVDEQSPAEPNREGGLAHLMAEELLRDQRLESPTTILRLAGIYGPGRLPRSADVAAGRPIASPPSSYLNLIHVEDAASVVLAAWSTAKTGLYLVSDDCPVQRGEFYREIARRLDAPPPSFVDSASTSPGNSEIAPANTRSAGNKRIRNTRMKRDLLPTLRFPTYREGLADAL